MNSNDTNTGFRVIDPEGGTHDYPAARAVNVDRGDLYLFDENNNTVAVFRRWEQVEQIADPSPQPRAAAHEVHISTTVDAGMIERLIADADVKSHFSRRGR